MGGTLSSRHAVTHNNVRKVAYIRNSKDYLSDELYELEKELSAHVARQQLSDNNNNNSNNVTNCPTSNNNRER